MLRGILLGKGSGWEENVRGWPGVHSVNGTIFLPSEREERIQLPGAEKSLEKKKSHRVTE